MENESVCGGDDYFVNGNLGDIGPRKDCSLCKSKNSKGREIPSHPGNLDGPQFLLSSASQGFDFYVGDLDVIEMVLDSFHRTLCSFDGESDRLGFWWGHPFSRGRRRRESGELEKDTRSVDDLPLFGMAGLFVPDVKIGVRFSDI